MKFNQILVEQDDKFSALSKCKSTEDILRSIIYKTDKILNKYYPHSYYAKRRLEYLTNDENESHIIMVQELFRNRNLLNYLLEFEEQVRQFIEVERPKYIRKYNVTETMKNTCMLEYVSTLTTIDNEIRMLVNEMLVFR